MELDYLTRTQLDHIITRPNFVAPIICEALKQNIDRNTYHEKGVLDMKSDVIHDMDTIHNKETRYVLCGTEYRNPELVNGVIKTIVERVIEPSYRVTVQYWEWPQLLVYPEDGGHYKPHIDGEYKFIDDKAPEGEWRRISDRDLSLLIYLNDNYEGGEVVFPDLNMQITPKQGQILIFPSNRHFLHGVMPVHGNTRHVIVTWLTVHGTPRVVAVPPPFHHVMRDDFSAIQVADSYQQLSFVKR
jgi:hypothetical protein